MKEYKVGDTIYVKGKVKAIDNTVLPYCVDFGNGNNFIDFESGTVWVTSDNMIDELPTAEPVKPVLPEKVALTKEQAEIVEEAHDSNYPASYIAGSSDDEKLIMKAYVNGYTVEKDKKYQVELDGLVTTDGAKQYLTKKGGQWFASRIQPSLHQVFTDKELNKAPDWAQQLNREEVTDDGK